MFRTITVSEWYNSDTTGLASWVFEGLACRTLPVKRYKIQLCLFCTSNSKYYKFWVMSLFQKMNDMTFLPSFFYTRRLVDTRSQFSFRYECKTAIHFPLRWCATIVRPWAVSFPRPLIFIPYNKRGQQKKKQFNGLLPCQLEELPYFNHRRPVKFP